MASEPPPPWLVYCDNGDIYFSGVPDRLLRHPELQARGLVPVAVLKPGVVFSTDPYVEPAHVIKILNPNREELSIYQQLLQDLGSPANHILPCEITRSGHPLLIMPLLSFAIYIYGTRWSRRNTLDMIFQFIEGLEYLHDQHIAHLDICQGNVMGAVKHCADQHPRVTANRLYIIDYDSARRFPAGPGIQAAITLPPTQFDPPEGLTHFDPYSWDVHCAGRALESMLELKFNMMQARPPRLARWYIQWLVGNERGCSGVCHCRPTARTARRVLVPLRWLASFVDGCERVVRSASHLYHTRRSE